MASSVGLPRHRRKTDGDSRFGKSNKGTIVVDVCILSALHALDMLSQMRCAAD
jgi:hypothetical protein